MRPSSRSACLSPSSQCTETHWELLLGCSGAASSLCSSEARAGNQAAEGAGGSVAHDKGSNGGGGGGGGVEGDCAVHLG